MVTDKKGYLCSPLSAPTQEGIEINMLAAKRYQEILEEEFCVDVKATHIYLPKILNDNNPKERELALKFGKEILKLCSVIFVCGDHISNGMMGEIQYATSIFIPIFVFNRKVYDELLNIGIISTLVAEDEILGENSSVLGLPNYGILRERRCG